MISRSSELRTSRISRGSIHRTLRRANGRGRGRSPDTRVEHLRSGEPLSPPVLALCHPAHIIHKVFPYGLFLSVLPSSGRRGSEGDKSDNTPQGATAKRGASNRARVRSGRDVAGKQELGFLSTALLRRNATVQPREATDRAHAPAAGTGAYSAVA